MTMKKMALCATILTYFTGLAQPADAQSNLPVNFPPSGYEGRQFVDNSGCVFVRAGYDGNITWVPRMTRSRSQICGQSPTFGGSTQAAAPAPAQAPARSQAAAPKQITMAPAAPTRVLNPAPTPAPQVVRSTATTRTMRAPAPVAPVRMPVTIKAPASKPIAAEPPRVVRRVPAVSAPVAGTTVRIPTREACMAGQNYRMVNGKRVAIRCGPQTTPHVTTLRRGDAPTAGGNVYYNRSSWQDSRLSPQTRIVPRHVYEQRDTQIASVPAGYKPAWEDDRLNPYRAIQTVQGHADTQRIWTNQVPRRLISQANPRKPFPANLWTKKYKHEVKSPIIAYRSNDGYPPASVRVAYAEQAQYRTDVLSTRGNSKASGGGYVTIGLFSTRAKAQAAAARLSAAGFPVQAAQVARNGQNMQRLRVGPYGTATAVQAALSAVHRSGYTQAYVR